MLRAFFSSSFLNNLRKKSLRRRRKDAGSSLVEIALVIILLLSVVFGISGFGHALYVYHFVNTAAKSASRWAAVNGATCNDDSSCNGTGGMNSGPASATDIQNYVLTLVPPGIDSTKVTVTAGAATVTNTPAVCATTWNSQGCTVQVQVAYAFNFIFPLLPASTATTAPCTNPGLCLYSTSDMVIAH